MLKPYILKVGVFPTNFKYVSKKKKTKNIYPSFTSHLKYIQV